MNSETENLKPSRSRAATLVQVATEAGVSAVAASVVLNGSRTGTRVSAATRERILEAASLLQYTPNAVAQSLRNKSTNAIAFYNSQNTTFDPRYPFFAAILAGVQAGCEDHRKDLHIHGRFRGSCEEDIYLGLLNGQIDGLVLYARTVTPLIERIVRSHLPVVSVSEEIPGVPYVGIDEKGGSQMLARHIAEKGYKRVLYRRTDEVLPSTLQERFEAFMAEGEALGLELSSSRNNEYLPNEQELRLLESSPEKRPQVVVCWSDWSADGIAAYCQSSGLRVPQDIAIVGFDGLPSLARPSLNLTTILAPWSEVASTAVGLLSAQCAGKEVPQRTILPVKLFQGTTT